MVDNLRFRIYQEMQKSYDDILKDNLQIILKEKHDGLNIQFNTTVEEDLDQDQEVKNNPDENDNNRNTKSALDGDEARNALTENKENKNDDDLIELKHNSLTIVEHSKIKEIRRKIFKIQKEIEKIIEKNASLSKEIKELEESLASKKEEVTNLTTKLSSIVQKEIDNKNFSFNTSSKKFFINNDIKSIEKKITEILEKKQELKNKKEKNNIKIRKFESTRDQEQKKLNKYLNELKLNIPANSPALWIKRSYQIDKLHKKLKEVTTEKEVRTIRKKIFKIDEEMVNAWDCKRVERIYEQILQINNRFYFITVVKHADNSIAEKIMYFQDLKDDIAVVIQTKEYSNLEEYKTDTTFIEDIRTTKKNVSFNVCRIEEFLKKQETEKIKIKKSEILLCVTISLFHIILLSVFAIVPQLAIIKVVGVTLSYFSNNLVTYLVEDKTQKIKFWFKQKFYSFIRKMPFIKKVGKTTEEKNTLDNIKKRVQNLKKDDILKTKLKTQYDILKDQLKINKNKNGTQLINDKKRFENKDWDYISKEINKINSDTIQPTTLESPEIISTKL